MGHILDPTGVSADPEKVTAITKMKAPTGVPELRRFLGMVNQMGKFSDKLAELSRPLRELLAKVRAWTWGPDQEKAFSDLKQELSRPTTLALYDLAAQARVAADASSFGLGAVLLQKEEGAWRPVAFASRSMSETERRYAQIEKEALAVTWACEKFSPYVWGKSFKIDKPLVPLLGSTRLDSLPPRLLRFRLRLARFSYTADTLSRAPTGVAEKDDRELEEVVEKCVRAVVKWSLPACEERLSTYKKHQEEDEECFQLIRFCQKGWPMKHKLPAALKQFWEARGLLTLSSEGLLLYSNRIVIPASLREETLAKIHQATKKCRLRAQTALWWPGMSKRIATMVHNCRECSKYVRPHHEPMIPTELPQYPWQKLGAICSKAKESSM